MLKNKQAGLHIKMLLLVLALLFAFTAGCSPEDPAIPPEDPDTPAEDCPEEARRRLEEWEQRNEELKEELGKNFVPLPHPDQPENPPVKVRAIYITGHSIAFTERYQRLLKLIEETELNAVVIDVKDIDGKMSYVSEIGIVQEIEAYFKPAPLTDVRATLDEFHDRDIYTIARISVFKDSHLAARRPAWGLQLKEGGIYRDRFGFWMDPFREEVWDYNIAIAKEAALLGFREIQFDYIRFPEGGAALDRRVNYQGRDGRLKAEAIKGFIKKARAELAPYNVYVSHDVFGVIGNTWGDNDDIGQIWEDFAAHCDYISPMIYPSHYGVNQGWFGYAVPDAHPAGTVTGSLRDALKRNAAIKNPAVIRPWLQAFTASWIRGHIPYGAREIRAQIDAALALGIDEYMLWDPHNENYPREALYTAAEADRRAEQVRQDRETGGEDFLGRTARQAVEAYLEAIKERRWREAYALQGTGHTMNGDFYRDWLNQAGGRLEERAVTGTEQDGDTVFLELDLTVRLRGEEHLLEGERWPARQENNVWRVEPSLDFLKLIEGVAEEEEKN